MNSPLVRLKIIRLFSKLFWKSAIDKRINKIKIHIDQILQQSEIICPYQIILESGEGEPEDLIGRYLTESVLRGEIRFKIFTHLIGVSKQVLLLSCLHEYSHGIVDLANHRDNTSILLTSRFLDSLKRKRLIHDYYLIDPRIREDLFCEWFAKYLMRAYVPDEETVLICQEIITRFNFLIVSQD